MRIKHKNILIKDEKRKVRKTQALSPDFILFLFRHALIKSFILVGTQQIQDHPFHPIISQ